MRNTTLAALRRQFKKSFLTVILLTLPLGASGAGLGKLTVLSALGQPLRAEVELSASREELTTLSARIASPNAFQQAGIEYNSALSGIRFVVGQRANSQPYLDIQSDRPFNEPFLDLLVELNWSSGRLVREYTFLLDPPQAVQKQQVPAPTPQLPEIRREATPQPQQTAPAISPIQAARPAVAPPTPADEVLQKKPAAEMQVIRGADGVQRITKLAEPTQEKAEKQAVTRAVQRGDTLGKIAAEAKPEGVNLDQMLVALFRGNQEAFAGNINRLKAGKILAIPDRETIAEVNPEEARKTIQAHAADFNAYTRKLASTVAGSPALQDEPKRAVSGKIAPKVEDKAPAASAGKDKLEVSKTEAAKGTADKSGAARIAAIEETLVSREKALKDANSRVAELEKNLNDLKKLVELKNQGLAELQKQAQAGKSMPAAPAKEPASTPKPTPAAAPKPAEPAPAVATKPAEPAPPATNPAAVTEKKPAPPAPAPTEPSFIDDSPEIVYGGSGILVLLLAYLGYVRWRKQRQAASEDADERIFSSSMLDSNGQLAGEDLLSPTDFSSQPDMPANEPPAVVDPVAEADVYLAYGRDVQAEEILIDALKTDPTRLAIHLKLLEIYATRKSVKQFENIATDLHSQTGGTGADWNKASALGRDIDPGNPLYVTESVAPEEFDASATMVIQPEDVLQDLVVAEPALEDLPEPGIENVEMLPEAEAVPQEEVPASLDFDFNLPSVGGDVPAAESMSADLSMPLQDDKSSALDMDLDLNVDEEKAGTPAQEPVSPASAPSDLSAEPDAALDFDFDLGEPAEPQLSAPEEPAATPESTELADTNIIDFDFELPAPETAKPVAPSVDLSSISLDLDEPKDAASPTEVPPAPAPEPDDAAAQDVATKLELAQAYEEMGDKEGARELLQEVLNEGNAAQQEAARNKLSQLG